MGSSCSALSDEALSYLPVETQMEHGNLQLSYFPGHIPHPLITPQIVELCSKSWKWILDGDSEILRQYKQADPTSSSITIFYDSFYSHLFAIAPGTRQFFQHGGIQKRAASLIQMISTGLNMINKEEVKVKKNLSFIAGGHGGKGIGPQHYGPVVAALFATLEQLLGDRYDVEVRKAWAVAYSYIVNIMVPVAADSVSQYNKKKAEEEKEKGTEDREGEDSFQYQESQNEYLHSPPNLHSSLKPSTQSAHSSQIIDSNQSHRTASSSPSPPPAASVKVCPFTGQSSSSSPSPHPSSAIAVGHKEFLPPHTVSPSPSDPVENVNQSLADAAVS